MIDKVDKNKLNHGSQKSRGGGLKTISNVGIVPYGNNTSGQNNFQPNSYKYLDSEAKITDLDADSGFIQDSNGQESAGAMELMEYDLRDSTKERVYDLGSQEMRAREVQNGATEEERAQKNYPSEEYVQENLGSAQESEESKELEKGDIGDTSDGEDDFSAGGEVSMIDNGDNYSDDANDEDDEENFIKRDEINSELEAISQKVVAQIVSNLEEYQQEISGVRPNTNKNRSLSHENGGLEVEKHDGKSKEDVWDDRSKEVTEMGEDAYEHMTDASTSTIRKSFVHRQKQDKKRQKRQRDAGQQDAGARMGGKKSSHVDKVNSSKSDSKGGGIVF